MAEMTTEEVLKLVKERLADKNEVITVQQQQIQQLEARVAELEAQLADCQKAAADRDSLIRGIAAALD